MVFPLAPSIRLSTLVVSALLPLCFIVCGANGQTPAPDRSGAKQDLFDEEDYFREDSRDSLKEMLDDAIDRDASSQTSESDDPIADDMDTDIDALNMDDDTDTDFDEDDQKERDAQAEAANARQRAMIGHLQRLQRPLSQVTLAAATSFDGPPNRAAQVIGHQVDHFVTSTGARPSVPSRHSVGYSHQPLYFEETNLERCGQHHGCLQNCVSGIRFLSNVAILPYRLKTERPDQKVRSRGDCRTDQSFPNDVPPLVQQGKNRRGVLAQAATMAGFTFLLL